MWTAQVLDLQQQTNLMSSLTTYDDSFVYVDSYMNPCLNKLETCANGITLVVNVTVVNSNAYARNEYGHSAGRQVLLTSGGDNSYAYGGFYLHQISARGENYLEFGLGLYENIYKSQVNNKFLILSFVSL
jgi:hypothetical protein